MSKPDFSDEELMRFADGELDPETAARLERAMETDDELVSRAALFIDTRSAAKAALAPLLDEPVPPQLERAVAEMAMKQRAGATVVPFPSPQAAASARRWRLPMAASIAAVLGGLCGYWLADVGGPAPEGRPKGLHVGGVVVEPGLDDALAALPSGQEKALPQSGERFRAIASFRDGAQTLCREFELDSPDRSTIVSVACRSGAAWLVTFAVAAPGATDGYAPASSTDALEAYLAAIHAGPALDAAAELQSLAEISPRTSK
jgi:anti-sigma factor RsiW